MKRTVAILCALCMCIPLLLVMPSASAAEQIKVNKEFRIYVKSPTAGDTIPNIKDTDAATQVGGTVYDKWADYRGPGEELDLNMRKLVDGESMTFKFEIDKNAIAIRLDEFYIGDSGTNYFDIKASANGTDFSCIASYGNATAAFGEGQYDWSSFDQSYGRYDNNKTVVAAASLNEAGTKKVVYVQLVASFNGEINGTIKYSNFIVKSEVIASVTGIEIKDTPKDNYFVGDALDVTGGKITVTYDNGETEDIAITADMVTGFDGATAGTQELTVTYAEQTDTYTVTVEVPTVTGIVVTTSPDKLVYYQTDTLDVTGGEITVSYSDKGPETKPITAGMVTGFDSSIKSVLSATQTLTVTYAGFSNTFDITMKEREGTFEKEWRVDQAPLNVEDPTELADQEAIWAKEPFPAGRGGVDSTGILKDELFAKTIMQWGDIYMNIESEGYAVYEVDLEDRATGFTIGGWGAYRNCKFLASKDDGVTWYVIADITDQLGLGASITDGSQNKEQCAKNIEWILIGNPDKKFLLKIITDETDTQALFANIILKQTYNSGETTADLDLPTTVPDDYEIPDPYVAPTPDPDPDPNPSDSSDPDTNNSNSGNSDNDSNNNGNNNGGNNDSGNDFPGTGSGLAMIAFVVLALAGGAILIVRKKIAV